LIIGGCRIHCPIAIFKDAGRTNYAEIVPDVDGCFPTGDTIDETIEAAQKKLVIIK